MPLAGIALAPLLVSPLSPPSPCARGSVAVSAEPRGRRRALRRVRCSAVAASGGGGNAGELSRATLLWRAAKLPIYSMAHVPLTVGAAAAYNHAGLFFSRCYFGLLAAVVLVITWLNLSNDVYNSDTGADKNKKESVVNIVGSRAVTQYAANLSLLLGFGGLFWAFAEAGDVRFMVLVLCAILCGYVYQCLPFRLSYRGLGEPLSYHDGIFFSTRTV
ncbi:2-carboxy-1,4-naphthoquinone phytyltransferase, chloroplastic-like [Hordeum vulgare subsp. vulgare]|uniref:2-carboxy-1,4-naphthoquinone phytyltransferase, chloroplastic-like n=1 Tax=Hordeum vulgare subsp. vulgare TaxID=112509 RepID=UPI001D1A375E|nr:2-carboxy-1,4-naphthoquinone phytyltransferase, chloroplastic-like [Hordeum vulgare subsp. vulgare]